VFPLDIYYTDVYGEREIDYLGFAGSFTAFDDYMSQDESVQVVSIDASLSAMLKA
jgi:hypothetical protein